MKTRRNLMGTVLSHKMQKTAIVEVVRRTADEKFGKTMRSQKSYKVHDEKDSCQEGDVVLISECRPISRDKRWRLLKVLKRAVLKPGEEVLA